ncbi:CLUMA_CG009864, isoform A [Clunio marinus]|uniref:CLUMA_CG009864, isoform A n=1 Tax=Clunio marinus TaxID=568069 RepID=A0A1J1IE63_9DIPT|nr:CLUMA_CG009864, isoform A [Clunio marinus]
MKISLQITLVAVFVAIGTAEKICVEVPTQVNEACSLSLDSGSSPCPEPRIRFSYNSLVGICTSFEYFGCDGEVPGNFDSSASCQSSCIDGTPTARCMESIFEGSCRGQDLSSTRWYSDGGECKEFTYSGCGGNANNFESLEACEASCP